ncbi:MAG: hypothetical protein EOP48_03505 [Sphingobacteriales bacterium]|nr:MAG: hypothetical protein EOP48_03505 [Sphingobacteriales bacterium]
MSSVELPEVCVRLPLTDTNILSSTVEEDIIQESGECDLRDVLCDSLSTKEFHLLDSGGSVVASDSEMRFIAGVTSDVQIQINSLTATNTSQQTEIDNLQADVSALQTDVADLSTHVSETIQDQIDSIVTVNNTQTDDIVELQTQIDELRNDHDSHVENDAVLLTTDQSIGGNKAYTSSLATNGIRNIGEVETTTLAVSSISKFGEEATIQSTKPVIATLSPGSYGTSTVNTTAVAIILSGSVTIPSYTQRFINWSVPFNLVSSCFFPLMGGSCEVTDTLSAIQFSVKDELNNTVSAGTAAFDRSLPLTYTLELFTNVSTDVSAKFHYGTVSASFTSPSSNISKHTVSFYNLPDIGRSYRDRWLGVTVGMMLTVVFFQ